jgi:trimeric autotransporter adhesin
MGIKMSQVTLNVGPRANSITCSGSFCFNNVAADKIQSQKIAQFVKAAFGNNVTGQLVINQDMSGVISLSLNTLNSRPAVINLTQTSKLYKQAQEFLNNRCPSHALTMTPSFDSFSDATPATNSSNSSSSSNRFSNWLSKKTPKTEEDAPLPTSTTYDFLPTSTPAPVRKRTTAPTSLNFDAPLPTTTTTSFVSQNSDIYDFRAPFAPVVHQPVFGNNEDAPLPITDFNGTPTTQTKRPTKCQGLGSLIGKGCAYSGQMLSSIYHNQTLRGLLSVGLEFAKWGASGVKNALPENVSEKFDRYCKDTFTLTKTTNSSTQQKTKAPLKNDADAPLSTFSEQNTSSSPSTVGNTTTSSFNFNTEFTPNESLTPAGDEETDKPLSTDQDGELGGSSFNTEEPYSFSSASFSTAQTTNKTSLNDEIESTKEKVRSRPTNSFNFGQESTPFSSFNFNEFSTPARGYDDDEPLSTNDQEGELSSTNLNTEEPYSFSSANFSATQTTFGPSSSDEAGYIKTGRQRRYLNSPFQSSGYNNGFDLKETGKKTHPLTTQTEDEFDAYVNKSLWIEPSTPTYMNGVPFTSTSSFSFSATPSSTSSSGDTTSAKPAVKHLKKKQPVMNLSSSPLSTSTSLPSTTSVGKTTTTKKPVATLSSSSLSTSTSQTTTTKQPIRGLNLQGSQSALTSSSSSLSTSASSSQAAPAKKTSVVSSSSSSTSTGTSSSSMSSSQTTTTKKPVVVEGQAFDGTQFISWEECQLFIGFLKIKTGRTDVNWTLAMQKPEHCAFFNQEYAAWKAAKNI